MAQRSDYINRAINDFVHLVYSLVDKAKARTIFQPLVDTQAVTFASAGVTPESTYNNMPLALTKSGSTKRFTYHPRKDDLDNDTIPHIGDAAFVVEADKIYAYDAGTILSSGTGTFYHLKKDEGIQGTTDVSIPSVWWDTVVDMACGLYFSEIGDLGSLPIRAERVKITLAKILGAGGALNGGKAG